MHKTPVVDLMAAQGSEPWKILIATILSARTKDQTTAAAVRRLFPRLKNIQSLSKIPVNELEELIYPVGFFRDKADHLHKLPQVLNEKFNGVLPQSVEELCELPGVGRKTANLVAAKGFNLPAICVDVHVHRINNRLGFIKTKDPLETEMTLRKKLPVKYWIDYNSIFVSFGQNTCTPLRPNCSGCPVYKYCRRCGI